MASKKALPEVKEINKEIKRLRKIFDDLEIDESKKSLAMGPIEDLAFMRVTLKKLKDIVNTEGVIDEMDQGGYTIQRTHPALKSFNDMIPKYNSSKQLLLNLLPKGTGNDLDDGFEAFVSKRG